MIGEKVLSQPHSVPLRGYKSRAATRRRRSQSSAVISPSLRSFVARKRATLTNAVVVVGRGAACFDIPRLLSLSSCVKWCAHLRAVGQGPSDIMTIT